MGRPTRYNVDYFPHMIGNGKKMNFIQNKYGNDGYATWFKILESLAETDYHYLSLIEEEDLMFLSSKCLISDEQLLSILNDLSRLKIINPIAWSDKVIWCDKFIESIQYAYDKRTNNTLSLLELSELLKSLGILKHGFTKIKGDIYPQSKVKESKVKIYRTFAHLELTVDEYEKLIQDGYSKSEIDNTLGGIENYRKNTSYKSLNLTVRNWINKDRKKDSPLKKEPTQEDVDFQDQFYRRKK